MEEKSVNDVLEDPKTSLEQIRRTQNAFNCHDTIYSVTVRRISKNVLF